MTMKSGILAATAFLVGTLLSAANPTNTCMKLVGTYADPQRPEKLEMTVVFTNGQFVVTDLEGHKETVTATPTEHGLVFVEDPRDRNVFRISPSTKPGVFLFEHLGKHRVGTPLPERADWAKEMIRVPPGQNDSGDK